MPQRILVVEAHPDDAEWYCGGTLAKLARDGADITFVICTEGDKGSYDLQTNPVELAAKRKREQEAARALLGVREVRYLGIPDGELAVTFELRRKLALLYRELVPEMLFTFDPWRRDEFHPDHRACGTVALDARLAAKMPLYYPNEQELAPWAIRELWLFSPGAPNHYEDVTGTFDTRLAALRAHASQTVGDAENVAFITELARADGEKIGTQYAESFHRVVIEGSISRVK